MTVKYKGSAFLKYDDDQHYKKGSDEQNCQLINKALGVPTSDEKKKNLKHFWRNSSITTTSNGRIFHISVFYKEIFFGEGPHLEIGEELTHQHGEDGCDRLEDDFAMHV
ncbi:hypothetical protein QE152_g1842 [Popillia japonica]|uniref:DNA-directed RNA polymerase n=1 Tax=Popillia japonica TaxID=7064 RepID=A0AAW1N318_POPJA